MDYFYHGEIRFRGIWPNPTTCGMYLALGAIVCLALAIHSAGRSKAWVSVLFLFLCAAFEYFLVRTYSRAGYVSLGAALALHLKLPRRLVAGAALLMFAAALVCTPFALSRTGAITDLDDKAISNRFLLWESSSAMIADGWRIATKDGIFKDTHQAWYAQPSMKGARYFGPVNGFLDLGLTLGVWPLALILGLFAYCLIITVGKGLLHDELYSLTVASVILIYGVENVFSAQVNIWWNLLSILAVVHVAKSTRKMFSANRQLVLGGILASLLFSLLATTALHFYGKSYTAKLGYAANCRTDLIDQETAANVVELRPISASSIGNIFICLATPEQRHPMQSMARFWVSRGIRCYYLEIAQHGLPAVANLSEAVARIRADHKLHEKPVTLVGIQDTAQYAFLAGCDPDVQMSIAAIDLAPYSPITEMSPSTRIADLRSPLLLISTGNSAYDEQFQSRCLSAKASVVVEKLESEINSDAIVIELASVIAQWAHDQVRL